MEAEEVNHTIKNIHGIQVCAIGLRLRKDEGDSNDLKKPRRQGRCCQFACNLTSLAASRWMCRKLPARRGRSSATYIHSALP
eukprot:3190104-Amphidinium_carterae.1